jgi:hypothetical protein
LIVLDHAGITRRLEARESASDPTCKRRRRKTKDGKHEKDGGEEEKERTATTGNAKYKMLVAGGWWLVAGGWWLVVDCPHCPLPGHHRM